MSTLTPARVTAAASKRAEKPTVKPGTVTPTDDAPADPWASLMAEAEIAPAFVRGPRTVDVTVPVPVKMLLEQSLAEWNLEFDDPNGKTLAAGTAKFRVVNLGSVTRAKEFLVFARAWARNRDKGQVSVRAFQVKHGDKDAGNSPVVKFAAMPLVKNETRSMTAANGASSADVRKWAVETGMEVPAKGKLKPEVFNAYNAAHPAEMQGQASIDA